MSEHHSSAEPREPRRPKIYYDQVPADSVYAITPKQAQAIRYIHERKPRRRWWRRILGRWGR